jgi:hypothetical protein
MHLDDNPLSLVFEISAQLVKYYQSFNDKILLRLADRLGSSHEFFRCLKYEINNQKNINLFGDYFFLEAKAKARNLFGNYFGCGQSIKIEYHDNEFWRMRAMIYNGVVFTNEICPACKGTKIDQKASEIHMRKIHCNDCFGSGFRSIKQFSLANELASNVCFLLYIVELLACNYEQALTSSKPMLMFLQTNDEGYSKQFISGYYTYNFKNYLQNILDTLSEKKLIAEVSLRMMNVYNKISYGENRILWRKLYDFSVDIHRRNNQDVFFLLQVPGQNGCHVYSDSSPSIFPLKYEEEVYSLVHHNIDTSKQQLALIAGLAYLCGKARNWIKEK